VKILIKCLSFGTHVNDMVQADIKDNVFYPKYSWINTSCFIVTYAPWAYSLTKDCHWEICI